MHVHKTHTGEILSDMNFEEKAKMKGRL